MYELSRIRLHSVGPKGARYRDVVIDLRDVGVQAMTHRTRRPSPATVLFLENGGGKTVLMRLIFSVMLPGRRNVLGSSASRGLEDYVLAGDVAHVALEWQHTGTGDRVVTAKASEWRGHTVSSDPNKLTELWYTFRPSAAFNLDTLPLTVDGRLVTLSGFREQLSQAVRLEPQLQAASETNHKEWLSKLDNLGLDAELFRYQRAMNAGEGEAADAFTFKSDQAFVEFLLRAVTDEEDTRGLADVVSGYSAKLSQRGTLIAERDFVAGALERINPLSVVARDAAAATELARGARNDAERLTTTLVARQQIDAASLKTAEAEAAEIVKTENAADLEVRRLGAIVLELRRLVAGLRLQEAEQIKRDLETERDTTRDLLAAWKATDVAIAHHKARAKAAALQSSVEEKAEQARPAMRARDHAARMLAQALLAAADQAERERLAAERRAKELDQTAIEADDAAQEATQRSAEASSEVATAQSNIGRIEEALSQAVSEGLLDSPGRIADRAKEAGEEAVQLEEAVSDAWHELTELAGRRGRSAEALNEARQIQRDRQAEAHRCAEAADTATSRSAALAGEARLAEILGSQSIDLDTDAAALLDCLDTAVGNAEQERAMLQLADAKDARILQALGTGKLLPPQQAVAEALEVLEGAGITAWPGWSYLAELPASERNLACERYPHLIDGIVVNNAANLGTARELLTEARLLPAMIIAVGTTADLHNLNVAPPTGLDFILPPNPALYDVAAAAQERQRLIQEKVARHERLQALEAVAAHDRELAGRLRAWQLEYPPGTLSQLRTESETAAAQADLAGINVMTAEAAAAEAAGSEERHRQMLPGLEKAAGKSRQQAEKLAALAIRAAEIRHWTEVARQAREVIADASTDLANARQRARHCREQASAQRDLAGDKRRIKDASHEELSSIVGGGQTEDHHLVPTEPLAELRERYKQASDVYAKVEIGQDLLGELRTAQQKEAEARATWQAVPANIRTHADRLLQTPDGADAPSRLAAAGRADRELESLGRQIDRAAEDVGALKSQFLSFTPQDRSLDPFGKPRDIAHGTELITEANNDFAKARNKFDDLKAAREELETKTAVFKETVTSFAAIIESFAGLAPPSVSEDVQPFRGSVAEARNRRTEAQNTLAEAEKLVAEASRKVRDAADALAQYAVDPRFEAVASLVRRQIIAVNRESLPDYAAEWESALRPRLRTLDDDLAHINEHRGGIVTRLQGMVAASLATLRSAQRLSKLPPGMGDWAGQEFLRIRFSELDPAVLRERLGQVVDEEVSIPDGRSDKARGKDGSALLLRAVHAAMPKGVVVEMLKPDAVLRTERVRVSSISDVFSGGQLLTAAIILYCTLARLRANERGQTHRPHAGVLFLDNPIGRASAGYLLELQLAVAQALGVQLIYTTGLFDTNALAVFPLVVRLRNDADLRAGLKYLSVDSEIRRQLDALQEPDGTGRLTAMRVFVRPRREES